MTDNIHFKIGGGYQYEAYHNGICFQRSWHRLKFEKALQLLNISGGDTILDAACGSGVLTGLMAEHQGVHITAVDFNEAAIEFCKRTCLNPNVLFFKLDLQEKYFNENSFSKIVMLEVVEHLMPDVAATIFKNLYYYLKPRGKLIISTPNKKSLWPAIEFLLDSFKLTPKMKGEQHVKLYNASSITKVLNAAGFTSVKIETTHFIAPWLSFLGLGVAKKIGSAEQKIKVLPGSLLFVVAEK